MLRPESKVSGTPASVLTGLGGVGVVGHRVVCVSRRTSAVGSIWSPVMHPKPIGHYRTFCMKPQNVPS